MLERVKHMLIKEFIQVFRDPRMKGIIFGIPLIQTFIFGYAVTTDVKHIDTAVYDLDQSQASRELIARFIESGYFEIVEYAKDESRSRELIDQGKVQAFLQVNRGFEGDILSGKIARAQMIIDGTDSNTAGIIVNYSQKIAGQFSQHLLNNRLKSLTGSGLKSGQVDLQIRAWFNENLESRNFYVPGVIVNIITLVTLMLTSMAVVREKEIGTIEQVMVTPITPFEFILGKTIPFALISFMDVIGIILVGVFWFKIPVRGSLLLLFFAICLYLMTTLGIGLFISTVSRTQQQAMMSTFFFFFPAMLLSGFIFPIANMPKVIQWLTYINPLRYFMVIIRGIFLKGVGMNILWPQLMALGILGTVIFWLATNRFHKTI